MPIYAQYTCEEIENTLIIDRGFKDDREYEIVQISQLSFSHCPNIKEIQIASHVRDIEWNICGSDKIVQIHVASENINNIDIDGVLFTLDKTQLVGFPSARTGSYAIPYGTIKINNCAFKSSKLNEILIPDTIKKIGINVFYDCRNLIDIILLDKFSDIEMNSVFRNAPIKQFFYFKSDIQKINPYKILELIEKLKNR